MCNKTVNCFFITRSILWGAVTRRLFLSVTGAMSFGVNSGGCLFHQLKLDKTNKQNQLLFNS